MNTKRAMTKIRRLLTRYEKLSNAHCGHAEGIHKMLAVRFELEEFIEDALLDAKWDYTSHQVN